MLLTIPDQSVSTRALDRNRGGCEGHRLQPRRTQGRHRSRILGRQDCGVPSPQTQLLGGPRAVRFLGNPKLLNGALGR